MEDSLRIVRLFLASPSDVARERGLAGDIVEQINRSLAKQLGLRIEVLRWEDMPPGFGRPQEQINELVDGCDLFVGLLWEKWGTPTGKYSSGFYEEFERARSRRIESDKPDIWLFLKQLRKGKDKDPGTQLSAVLEFRKQQELSRELLWVNFSNAQQWRGLFMEHLLSYVASLIRRDDQVSPDNLSRRLPTPSTADLSTVGIPPTNLSAAFDEVAASLRIQASGEESSDTAAISQLPALRAYMYLHSIVARRYSGSTLQTHEINLLYRFREEFELETFEKIEIVRTILTEKASVAPGWFWLAHGSGAITWESLLKMSRSDVSENVRVAALEFLAGFELRIPKSMWHELPLVDGSKKVRVAAFKVLENERAFAAYRFIKDLVLFDSEHAMNARQAASNLLFHIRPNEAVKQVLGKGGYASSEMLNRIKEILPKLSRGVLLEGVKAAEESIRYLCFQELASRKEIDTSIAQDLCNDTSAKIRVLALQALVRAGEFEGVSAIRERFSSVQSDALGNVAAYASVASLLGGPSRDESTPGVDSLIRNFYELQTDEEVAAAMEWTSIRRRKCLRGSLRARF